MIAILEQQVSNIRRDFDRIAQAEEDGKAVCIRHAYYTNPDAAIEMKLLLDPTFSTHIGPDQNSTEYIREKKDPKPFDDFFKLSSWMAKKTELDEADLARVHWTLNEIRDPALRIYAFDLLCKTVKTGMTIHNVNQALRFQLVPEVICMTPYLYFYYQNIVQERYFYVTGKLPGVRCIAVVKKDSVSILNVQSVPITGLRFIEKKLAAIQERTGKAFVMDGKLLHDAESQDRSVFYAMDYLPENAFESRLCEMPYWKRRELLEAAIPREGKHVRVVPLLYHGTDTDQIIACLNTQREGININIGDAFYRFGKTDQFLTANWLYECNAKIIDLKPDDSRTDGMLGVITIDYHGTPVKVTAGLTDEYRWEIGHHPDKYIGRTALIQYVKQTATPDGKPTLRFPIFKSIK